MAVKIIRQPKNIVLLGAATSAAALRSGSERAPEALRAAGIADRLKKTGFQVLDLGDTSTYFSKPDEEHPRAKNVPTILKMLNDLRPRVEAAVKSGALPLILTGDCIPVLATIAGARRYFRNVSLIYMDRDADMNVPATSPSGCIDGMVISQVIGRGAPELVRFWGEPPLVREPDVDLFGFERLDPPEEQYLLGSPLRRHSHIDVAAAGGAAAARLALERVHAARHEFVLHFDVDLVNGEEFPWTNFPGAGGLSLNDVRDALCVFASQPNLAAFEVAGYNPELDPDGEGARKLVDLLQVVLAKRLEAMAASTDGIVPSVDSSPTIAAAASATGTGTIPRLDNPSTLSNQPAASDLTSTPEPDARNS